MIKFGLIGSPISHSKSPDLFKAAYGEGEFSYELIEAPTVEDAMQRFMDGEYRGINVTSPFKEKVFSYVASPDRISGLTQSANLLLKDDDYANNSVIHSYNTDYYGALRTVEEIAGKEKTGNVIVIGAGGAGKAAALAMADSGRKVFLANRSRERAEPFAETIGAEYCPLDDELIARIEESDLIIYSLSFLLEQLKEVDFSSKVVFEANYAHPQLCPERGVKSKRYIDGRYWLYNQAIPAFEIFTGKEVNALQMRRIIGID